MPPTKRASAPSRSPAAKNLSPRKRGAVGSYKHPESESPMRPEVGTQAQFKKKKPPQIYRCDSSLSPALDWDGQNSSREKGEALIKEIADCGLRIAKSAGKEAQADAANLTSKI